MNFFEGLLREGENHSLLSRFVRRGGSPCDQRCANRFVVTKKIAEPGHSDARTDDRQKIEFRRQGQSVDRVVVDVSIVGDVELGQQALQADEVTFCKKWVRSLTHENQRRS
jgi:hypothetical protein